MDGEVTGHAIAQLRVPQALLDAVATTDEDLFATLRVAGVVPEDPAESQVGGACLGAAIVVNGVDLFTVALGDVRYEKRNLLLSIAWKKVRSHLPVNSVAF